MSRKASQVTQKNPSKEEYQQSKNILFSTWNKPDKPLRDPSLDIVPNVKIPTVFKDSLNKL